MRHRPAPVLAAAALLLAAPLAAQPAAPDTLPFHRGQWGIEGTITGSSLGTGLLRLLSRSTALAFNVTADASSNTMETPGFSDGSVTTSEQTVTRAAVSATLGVRRYRAIADRVAGFGAVGALASYANASSEDSRTSGTSRQRVWGVGAFADLGATLLATPRLGLSAVYGLSVLRNTNRFTPSQGGVVFSEPRAHGWSVGTGGVRLNASIFF